MSGLTREVASQETFHEFQQCNSTTWTLSLLASQKHHNGTALPDLSNKRVQAPCLLSLDVCFLAIAIFSSAQAALIHHWDTASTDGHDLSFTTSAGLPDIQLIREEDMSAVCEAAQRWSMLSWTAAWVLHLCPSSPG